MRHKSRLVFPRVCDDGALALHHCKAEALEPGAFGILEPSADEPVVSLEEVDVILVPGLAFDTYGNRLGYGKGYYDRLLTGMDALLRCPLLVGISYDETLFECLPSEPHDIRMDVIATPTQVLRVS
jgi:5-formyltetrahydrofolate cyclo-ligase